MADIAKENPFETPEQPPQVKLGEAIESSPERRESEPALEKIETVGAKSVRQKLEQAPTSETGRKTPEQPESLEEKKERIISKLVETVLAMEGNIEHVKDITDKLANKYLDKYPEIVDNVHDRVAERERVLREIKNKANDRALDRAYGRMHQREG